MAYGRYGVEPGTGRVAGRGRQLDCGAALRSDVRSVPGGPGRRSFTARPWIRPHARVWTSTVPVDARVEPRDNILVVEGCSHGHRGHFEIQARTAGSPHEWL